MDEQSSRAGTPLPAEVAEHLRVCRDCQSLYRLLRIESSEWKIPEGLREKVTATLLGSLEPVRPLRRGRTFVLLAAAVFLVLSLGGGGMMGASALSALTWLQILTLTGVMVASALLLAISLYWQTAPGSYQTVTPVPLVLVVMAALFVSFGLLFPWRGTESFVSQGLRCWTAGFVLAIPTAVTFWWLVRRAVFLSMWKMGMTLGSLAGLAGAVAVQFNCAVREAVHLSVWHIGIVLASALIGSLAGKVFEEL